MLQYHEGLGGVRRDVEVGSMLLGRQGNISEPHDGIRVQHLTIAPSFLRFGTEYEYGAPSGGVQLQLHRDALTQY